MALKASQKSARASFATFQSWKWQFSVPLDLLGFHQLAFFAGDHYLDRRNAEDEESSLISNVWIVELRLRAIRANRPREISSWNNAYNRPGPRRLFRKSPWPDKLDIGLTFFNIEPTPLSLTFSPARCQDLHRPTMCPPSRHQTRYGKTATDSGCRMIQSCRRCCYNWKRN